MINSQVLDFKAKLKPVGSTLPNNNNSNVTKNEQLKTEPLSNTNLSFQEKLNLAKNFSHKESTCSNKLINQTAMEKKNNVTDQVNKPENPEKETKSIIQSDNTVEVSSKKLTNNSNEKQLQSNTNIVSSIQNNPILARANEIKQKEIISSLSSRYQNDKNTNKDKTTNSNVDSENKGNSVITNNLKQENKNDSGNINNQNSSFKNNPFLNSQIKTSSNNSAQVPNRISNLNKDNLKNNQVDNKIKENSEIKNENNCIKNTSIQPNSNENLVTNQQPIGNSKIHLSSTQKNLSKFPIVNTTIDKNVTVSDNKSNEVISIQNSVKKEENKNDIKARIEGLAKTFSMKNMMPVGLSKIPEEPIITTSSNTQDQTLNKIEVKENENENPGVNDNIDDILMRRTTRNVRVHKKTIMKF